MQLRSTKCLVDYIPLRIKICSEHHIQTITWDGGGYFSNERGFSVDSSYKGFHRICFLETKKLVGLRRWLINKEAICTGTAPLFWNFLSLFERPRTRLVRKIGSQNQSIKKWVWRQNLSPLRPGRFQCGVVGEVRKGPGVCWTQKRKNMLKHQFQKKVKQKY